MTLPLVRRYSRERWLAFAAAALGLFIVSVLLHNLIYGLFEVEEAFFFILATIVSPLVFIGSLVAAALAHPAPVGEGGRPRWWSFGPPRGRAGKLSLGLLVASGVGFLLFFGGIAFGQSGDDTFFSNPYLALTILFTGACAVLAGIAAIVSVLIERERSFGAFMTIVFGLFVAFFSIAEASGHDEPGDNRPDGDRAPTTVPQAPNSHTNLSAVALSPTEVRFSFDYAYRRDPAEAPITHLAVEALGPAGAPLPGYPVTRLPETGDLQVGEGHYDLDLQFTADELAGVSAVRVCFAGPDHPDFGCAQINILPQ